LGTREVAGTSWWSLV